MASKVNECPYAKALRQACHAFDTLQESMIQEEQELDGLLEKLGLSVLIFSPEIQKKIKEASEFLEKCNITNVEQASIVFKFARLVLDRTKEKEKIAKFSKSVDEFNNYCSSLQVEQIRLRKDVIFNRKAIDKTKSEYEYFQGPLNLELDPPSVPELDVQLNTVEDIFSVLTLVKEIKTLKKKRKRLQGELDMYNGLPPNLESAKEMIQGAKLKIKELSDELKSLASAF